MNGIRKREKSAILQLFATLYTVGISTVLPFFVRTFLIRFIGIEYVGVNSLFASILQVLNVADFGLTTSLAWFLYKPAEDNEYQAISACMAYFSKLFHRVGTLILIAGLTIMPFLPVLVKDKEYPAGLNIYVIYLVYILQTCIPYLTNAYMQTLLSSFLKGYINQLIVGTSLLIMYILQIISILVWKDYYIYTGFFLVVAVIQYISYAITGKRYFPWLNIKIEPDKRVISGVRERMPAMLVSKIRNVSRNSLDSVIISILFGLPVLGEYQNYYQVMVVPFFITMMIKTAIQPSLGNGISTESKESNYGIVKQYLFILHFVATICASCLISLIQPFIKLWIGPQYLLGSDIVICVTIYFYILCLAEGGVMLRETTGIWKEGMWVSIVEAGANLILNILLAKILGLYGIALATILTVGFINIPLENYFVFKGYFKGLYKDYMKRLLIYAVETALIVGVSYFICIKIQIVNTWTMIVRIAASGLIPAVLFLLVNFKNEGLRNVLNLIKRIFNGKKHNFE